MKKEDQAIDVRLTFSCLNNNTHVCFLTIYYMWAHTMHFQSFNKPLSSFNMRIQSLKSDLKAHIGPSRLGPHLGSLD